MSLIDTIRGAREEAEEAGSLPSAGKRGAKEVDGSATPGQDEASASATGFSKRSAARARPSREVAGTVRTSGSAERSGSGKKKLSREEKKAARDKRRTEEGIEFEASQILLKQQPGYQRFQRLWYILMGVGVACTLGSWGLMTYMQNTGNESQVLMAACIALMVAAYVIIIGDFIFDLVKIRPLRKKASEQAASMTLRRKRKLIAEHEGDK